MEENKDLRPRLFSWPLKFLIGMYIIVLWIIVKFSIGSSSCRLLNSSFTNPCTQLTNHNLWTLYFDISRNTHGVDIGYLLINPCGIQTYFSCHLESKCTNNDAKYKALIQGLRKEIDLNVKSIEAFGDSQLVIKKVRNSMFSTFYHLNNY